METINKQIISVDLKKSTMIPLPQFIQNDTNILEVQVKDNGNEADFTDIGKIVVNYKRPDKVVISRLLDASSNLVTYKIGLQEMEVAGHAEVEIQFFSADALQRISTKRFKVFMYESIGTDNIFEDSGDLTILQELFVEVEDLNNRMELAESDRESAETSRVNAESARTAAESDRSTAEAGRVSAEEARVTAEISRQNQESTRQSNEDARVSQENTRNTAEEARQTNTQNAIDNAATATNNANQAADNANSIANTLIHRGEYDPEITYFPRNVVSYFGSGYMNIVESTGIDPTNSTNWLLVSSKGDQGIQGIQGEPGPKGEPGTGNVNSVNGKYGPDIELNASDVGSISSAEKGAPNGVPTLDGNGKVPADQIDSSGYASQTEFVQLQDDVARHQAEKASKTGFGHVQIGDGINVTDGVISVAEMTATNVSTTSGSNVQTEIDNLKSSVSNGKLDVRNAITGKGGTVADADGDGVPTHAELAAGVTGLTTPKTDDGIIADEASLSYGVNMWGDFAYNNEADERVVIAYNNGTGAIYRGIVYEKNGQFYRETSNINAAINAVQRDELNIFLATNSNSIMAYPIDLMTTYKWIRTNYLTFGKMLRHKGKLICLENGSYYVRVLNTETGETEKSYLSPSTIGAMTIDDDGYLYIFDTSATVKKIDLLGLKSDNSVVWSVSGITVNGSGPTDIILSSNHVFAVTTAGQVTKMRKTDGLVIGNKNFGLNQTRIFFDRYDNTFTWVNGSQTIMFRGKETVEGGLRSFNTVGYNYRPVGNRRIYTGVGSNFKTMSIFYKT